MAKKIPDIPAEVWFLWNPDAGPDESGGWLPSMDCNPGGSAEPVLAYHSESDAKAGAEYQDELYDLPGLMPVRVK